MRRKSGHRAAECEEEPNLDNVTCRKCDESKQALEEHIETITLT